MNNPNSIMTNIMERRSTRTFRPDPIPREQLENLITCAAAAPSPLNNQPWKFIVITRKSLIERIADEVATHANSIEGKVARSSIHDYENYRSNATFFRSAPVLVVVLMKPMTSDAKGHLWGVPGFFDNERKARGDILAVGAACQNLMLSAESQGIGSCLMLYPLAANDTVRPLLNIEFPWEIAAYLPLGFPDEDRTAPKKRDLQRITTFIEEQA